MPQILPSLTNADGIVKQDLCRKYYQVLLMLMVLLNKTCAAGVTVSVVQCWRRPQSPLGPFHWLEPRWSRHSPHCAGSSAGSWETWNSHWSRCWSKGGCLGRDEKNRAMQQKQFGNEKANMHEHIEQTSPNPPFCLLKTSFLLFTSSGHAQSFFEGKAIPFSSYLNHWTV